MSKMTLEQRKEFEAKWYIIMGGIAFLGIGVIISNIISGINWDKLATIPSLILIGILGGISTISIFEVIITIVIIYIFLCLYTREKEITQLRAALYEVAKVYDKEISEIKENMDMQNND